MIDRVIEFLMKLMSKALGDSRAQKKRVDEETEDEMRQRRRPKEG